MINVLLDSAISGQEDADRRAQGADRAREAEHGRAVHAAAQVPAGGRAAAAARLHAPELQLQ